MEWYQQALAPFQASLTEPRMSTRLDDLGEDEFRLIIPHLETGSVCGGPASGHTTNSRVRSDRAAFFNWLCERNFTECHRLEEVKPPKPRELEIEILTDEQIDRILASINPGTVLGVRNIYSLRPNRVAKPAA